MQLILPFTWSVAHTVSYSVPHLDLVITVIEVCIGVKCVAIFTSTVLAKCLSKRLYYLSTYPVHLHEL